MRTGNKETPKMKRKQGVKSYRPPPIKAEKNEIMARTQIRDKEGREKGEAKAFKALKNKEEKV